MNLTSNIILIIGGTSGIGRALAESFHTLGNEVIVAGRRRQFLEDMILKYPGMHGIELDVLNTDAVNTFCANIREQFPKLNVLINNAGITHQQDITASTELSVSRAIIETNIISVLHITAELLPILKQQAQSTIITTTSGLAFVPRGNFPTYCASKAFLHSWLQSLRVQLMDTVVQVLELVPPYVQTELAGAGQATDPAAMPLADYVAEVMALLAQPNPPQGEILVERVKFLRFAEKNGVYEKALATLNEH